VKVGVGFHQNSQCHVWVMKLKFNAAPTRVFKAAFDVSSNVGAARGVIQILKFSLLYMPY